MREVEEHIEATARGDHLLDELEATELMRAYVQHGFPSAAELRNEIPLGTTTVVEGAILVAVGRGEGVSRQQLLSLSHATGDSLDETIGKLLGRREHLYAPRHPHTSYYRLTDKGQAKYQEYQAEENKPLTTTKWRELLPPEHLHLRLLATLETKTVSSVVQASGINRKDVSALLAKWKGGLAESRRDGIGMRWSLTEEGWQRLCELERTPLMRLIRHEGILLRIAGCS